MNPALIMFFAANPVDTNRMILLEREVRDIEAKIELRSCSVPLRLKAKWAARPDDVIEALIQDRATIVHFSGHGAGARGLVFHDIDDTHTFVSTEALQQLFHVLKDDIRIKNDIRVVVLNACHAEEQARAIAREIDCVIGMRGAIGDVSARMFSVAFYRALGHGRSVQNAFDQGLLAIAAANLAGESTPILLTRPGVSASEVYIGGDHPFAGPRATRTTLADEPDKSPRPSPRTAPAIAPGALRDVVMDDHRPAESAIESASNVPPESSAVGVADSPRKASKTPRTPSLLLRAVVVATLCPAIFAASPPRIQPIVPYRNPAEIAWQPIAGGHIVIKSSDQRPELPPREKNVESFHVSRNEITVEQYVECVKQHACAPPGTGEGCNGTDSDRRTHPINCVSWGDAVAYATWIARRQNKPVRLPTEAEFEYLATRSGKAKFPWGDSDPTRDLATLAGGPPRGPEGTSPVCSHETSLDSICDVIGNVWEWSRDSYTPPDSKDATAMVLRGGSWRQPPDEITADAVNWRDPFHKASTIGFRVVYSN